VSLSVHSAARNAMLLILALAAALLAIGASSPEQRKNDKERAADQPQGEAVEVLTPEGTPPATGHENVAEADAAIPETTDTESQQAHAIESPAKGSEHLPTKGRATMPAGAPGAVAPAEREAGAAAGNLAETPGRPGPVNGAEASGLVSGTAPLRGAAGEAMPSGPTSMPPGVPKKPPLPPKFPEFAEKQPGAVPEIPPGELFVQPSELPQFESQLGNSTLPDEDVSGLLMEQTENPGTGLPANFARIVVPSGTIQGSTESKQFHIEGGLILYYSNVAMSGDVADIDEKNETAVIKGNVQVVDPKYTLKTDELRVQFHDKVFEAAGFVQFTKLREEAKAEPRLDLPKKDRVREYFAAQQFELYCQSLMYNWETNQMTALGGVRAVHPFFNGTMERMDYDDDTKQYEMSGSVVIEVTNYDWVFATKIAEEKDEKRLHALTQGSTKITCERMAYSEKTGVAQFYGLPGTEVVLEQPKRGVRAAYMEVNDTTKDFYAEGTPERKAVYSQEEGQWLFDAAILKRDESPKEISDRLDHPLTAQAGSITYNYDRKRVEMRGGVRVEAGGSAVQAGELIQDETAKFFLIKDNVQIVQDENNQVYAAQVYVDTDKDVYTFVGLVQGKAKTEELPATEQGEQGAAGGTPVQAGVFQQQGTAPPAGGAANVAEGG